MGGQEVLKAKIEQLREYIASQGWSIAAEKEIDYGYQITITDGEVKTPVAVYTSGKVLVRGTPNSLQTVLQEWSAKPYIQSKKQTQQATKDIQQATQQTFEGPTTPSANRMIGIARIGSDESGKGDYYGPLVVAAVYIDAQSEQQLLALNVRDSKQLTDNVIEMLAEEIKKVCRKRGMIRTLMPEQYNQLYREKRNLNSLLAETHAYVIEHLAKKQPASLAVVDQFGDEALVRDALADYKCFIPLEQRPRAEDDVAVAAASIVARAAFVKQIHVLSERYGITLPKGASNPAIVTIGRELVARHGEKALESVAKLHFQTTQQIIQG